VWLRYHVEDGRRFHANPRGAADSAALDGRFRCESGGLAGGLAATLPGLVAIIARNRLRDFTALILVVIFMNSFEDDPWRSW
jgi:hypothetical protein